MNPLDVSHGNGEGALDLEAVSIIQNMVFEQSKKNEERPEQRQNISSAYTPSIHDVVCGKGKAAFEHEGNIRFREMVGTFLTRYSKARTKIEKSALVSEIIDNVKEKGAFVKKRAGGEWFEVGKHLAREKVGQTIRDMLHLQYRSSTKAKKKRREMEQAKANARMNRITRTHLEISEKIETLKGEVVKADDENALSELFTSANLDILRSLNRLREMQDMDRLNSESSKKKSSAPSSTSPAAAATACTVFAFSTDQLIPPPMLANTVTPELMVPSERLHRQQSMDQAGTVGGIPAPAILRQTSSSSASSMGGFILNNSCFSYNNGMMNGSYNSSRSQSPHQQQKAEPSFGGSATLRDIYEEMMRQAQMENSNAASSNKPCCAV